MPAGIAAGIPAVASYFILNFGFGLLHAPHKFGRRFRLGWDAARIVHFPLLIMSLPFAMAVTGAAGVIGANAQWSATLTVAVTPNAATSRIVGYRLLAFYP